LTRSERWQKETAHYFTFSRKYRNGTKRLDVVNMTLKYQESVTWIPVFGSYNR
jgi:hypothetical protein